MCPDVRIQGHPPAVVTTTACVCLLVVKCQKVWLRKSRPAAGHMTYCRNTAWTRRVHKQSLGEVSSDRFRQKPSILLQIFINFFNLLFLVLLFWNSLNWKSPSSEHTRNDFLYTRMEDGFGWMRPGPNVQKINISRSFHFIGYTRMLQTYCTRKACQDEVLDSLSLKHILRSVFLTWETFHMEVSGI